MAKPLALPVEDHRENTDLLLEQYIEICNKAIAAHQDQFPYKNMLEMGGKWAEEHPTDLALYDDEPKSVVSLLFKDRKLGYTHKSTNDQTARKAWRVNLSYVKHVIDNADDYIKHPERLDIDWLRSKLGLL